MLENYAAILTCWALLCEFSGLDQEQGSFIDDLIAEMNAHLAETNGKRLPWVWIMDIILSEMDAGRVQYPYCWDYYRHPDGSKEVALFIRASHVMDHLSTASHLRSKYDELPIKEGSTFKKQLCQSSVILADNIENTIHGQRTRNVVAISLEKLEQLGLYAIPRMQHHH